MPYTRVCRNEEFNHRLARPRRMLARPHTDPQQPAVRAQAQFRSDVAAKLGVSPDDVECTATAGSVNVDVKVSD